MAATTPAVIDETVPVDPVLVTYPGVEPECAWEALPTTAHLSTDDIDAPGTGPEGWGIYLEGMPEEGYFAWFSHEAGARNLVAMHNEAVETAEELETARDDLEALRAEVRQLGLRKTRYLGGTRNRQEAVEGHLRAWPRTTLPLLYELAEEAS